MSEVISLREQVAQAELVIRDRVIDHGRASAAPNADPYETN
jgi:hypothetical protein